MMCAAHVKGRDQDGLSPLPFPPFFPTPPSYFPYFSNKNIWVERDRVGLTPAGMQDLFNLSQFLFDIIQTEMFSSLTELRHTYCSYGGLWVQKH